MLPPVWCASHVVGEKPSQAAWDRPWVPWEGCRPRRAFSQLPCHRLGISHVAGHTLSRQPIDPLPWGVIGYQRQIDQTRLKIDAQRGLAVAHVRNDDHPAQPHGIVTTLKRWACGWEPYRLVWFQTASSIEACSDHV